MTLRDLHIDQSARVVNVEGNGISRQHLLDMGLIPDAVIKVVKYAPMGDPMEVLIHGYSLTLRLAEAAHIQVCPLTERNFVSDDVSEADDDSTFNHPEARVAETLHEHNSHPGYGEAGIYHDKTHEHPLS